MTSVTDKYGRETYEIDQGAFCHDWKQRIREYSLSDLGVIRVRINNAKFNGVQPDITKHALELVASEINSRARQPLDKMWLSDLNALLNQLMPGAGCPATDCMLRAIWVEMDRQVSKITGFDLETGLRKD